MGHLPTLLKQAGCQQIQSQTYRVPVGRWGGRVGEMLKQDIVASLPAIKSFLCTHAHISSDAFEKVIQILPDEWEQCQTIYEYYLAYGQRVS